MTATLQERIEELRERKSRADGKGCKCMAYSSEQCACDADWTPAEVYDLRITVAEQQAQIEAMRKALEFYAGDHGEWPRGNVANHALSLINPKQKES